MIDLNLKYRKYLLILVLGITAMVLDPTKKSVFTADFEGNIGGLDFTT